MLELGTATTQLINSRDVNLNWKNQLIYQHVLACMYVRYKARKISDIGCAHLWGLNPVSVSFLGLESIKYGNWLIDAKINFSNELADCSVGGYNCRIQRDMT